MTDLTVVPTQVPTARGCARLDSGLPDTAGGKTGHQLVLHLNDVALELFAHAIRHLLETPDCPSVTAHVESPVALPDGITHQPMALTVFRGLPVQQ